MGGGLMQLVAYGAQDVYLTGNPQITFFKVVYRRHTNFSMECIEQPLDSARFGGMHTVQVLRNGDLAGKMYLMTTLPSIQAGGAKANGKVAWVRRVGHALVDNIECTVGGSQVDKHYGMWYDLWYELTHTVDQERGYNKMVGDVPELTTMTDKVIPSYTLYVPLQFWFNRNTGLALPLIALQYHEVRFNIKLNTLANLVNKQNDATVVAGVADSAVELSASALLVDYIYLDSEERRRFAQVGHEYLIEQVQFGGVETLTGANSKVKLDFNHPCKELVWVVQSGAIVDNTARFLTDRKDSDEATLDAAAQKLAWGMLYVKTQSRGNGNAPQVIAAPTGFANARLNSLVAINSVEIVKDGNAGNQTSKFTFVVSAGAAGATVEGAGGNNYVRGAAANDLDAALFIATAGDGENAGALVGTNLTNNNNGRKNLGDKIKEVTVNVTTGQDVDGNAFMTINLSDVTVTRHELTMADVSIPISGFTDRRQNKADVSVNQPFNYGVDLNGDGSLVKNAKLQLNGHDRFDEREGAYFNYVQPAQHHTRTPCDGVNVYSFGLHPEQHQPSGTANLSRIDTTLLWLTIADSLRGDSDSQLPKANNNAWIFAFSYNVFRIMSGMGGLAYAN
jgi:hypothetical protein